MNEQTDERDMGSKKEGKFRRRAGLIKRKTIDSIKVQSQDKVTCSIALTAGIIQGLKYEGNFKRGVKAGLLVYTVIVGYAVALDLVEGAEEIKNA